MSQEWRSIPVGRAESRREDGPMRRGIVALALTVGLAGIAGDADAGGFAIREQSAYSQGWSFAGAAAGGPGISGMFWNPAIVTNARGVTADSSYTLIAPNSELTGTSAFGPGVSGNIGQGALAPASYFALPLNERISLGLSINAPFGLTTKPDYGFGGRVDNYSTRIFSVNVTPTVGVRVTDWLSLGLGVQFEYFKATLRADTPTIARLVSLRADDDRVALGLTAGALLKPWVGTEIGIGFRSSVRHDLNGTQSATGFPLSLLGAQPFSTVFKSPDMVNVGVRQRVTDAFTVAGTVEWTNWSRLGTIVARGPATLPIGVLPFNYDDGWFFSIGGEYRFRPDLMLRAGIGYEKSPVSDAVRTTRLPDDDRIWLSAGLSYDLTRSVSVDLGYSYLFVTGDSPVNQGPIFTGTAESDVHIVSLGLRTKVMDLFFPAK